MGNYWLHKAEEPLKEALRSRFRLYQGYKARSRSSGGFNDIRGIVMHHDADNTSGEDDWVLKYEYETAKDGPIGNFHVQRDGDVWFGAAGASNHAGRGGPVSTSRGTVPLNTGNLYLIGIEASNNGVGEVWPKVQMESYLILVTVLCKTFNLNPLTDIFGHWTWCEPSCPGRKIDPRGPTPSYPKFGGSSGTDKWNMQEVRKEVNARLVTSAPVPPQEDDLTPEQDRKLSELHSQMTKPIYPGRFEDPGGADMNVPWAVGWSWDYINSLHKKVDEILTRLDALET